ncbi:MAG: 16S rRNA (guanine(966)-N(2))-methyltransferase RsmD [Candidatus Eisenbacteria bacterium]|nr:16S rRNA (guanine(966)-N(2))-methyltransferase RsmD [Candidatus Eisenbacteria bacterium]
MRIVAGSKRGARLYTGRAERFRPTSDRVREAIFAILGGRVEERRVLDLCAGSGALGFEALSRGAREALFVEKNRRVAAWIERNARDLRLEDRTETVVADALRFLERDGRASRFDLVFADPPYGAGLVDPILERLANLPGERIAVIEREKREVPADPPERLREPAVYGDTVVEFFQFGPAGPDPSEGGED